MRKKASSVRIGTAGSQGRGIFASEKIQKGRVIEKSPALFLSAKEHLLIQKTDLVRYIFEGARGTAYLGLGTTSLYNHSATPNATWSIDRNRRTIQIKALVEIPKNHQVLLDYGFDPTDRLTWPTELQRYMKK